MSGRGRGSSQSSCSRGRGRGRSAATTEPAATASPSALTVAVSQVAPTIPPPPAPLTQPPPTDSPQVAPYPQLHGDSSHASQPDPPSKSNGFPSPGTVKKAISDVIELMLSEPWINYSKVLADVQKRWYEKWAEGFTWPAEEEKEIRKAFDYRAGRRYQQIMRDLRDGELQRLKWLSEMLRGRLLHRFVTDPGFLKHSGVNKVNRASPRGGC
ncbi:hypothetical protein PIB30_095925 [Stylosanthes scabra]|uniref:Uncharacterized protein n=1 Tax=Stylosanthes scabra TaxID=79078 RepID=A0ABU6VZ17_9FABA|nr:hypothetical protein [Stylosanthes scabra]